MMITSSSRVYFSFEQATKPSSCKVEISDEGAFDLFSSYGESDIVKMFLHVLCNSTIHYRILPKE